MTRLVTACPNPSNNRLRRLPTTWTSEQDDLLSLWQAILGRKWRLISSHVPGKSCGQCKERWQNKTFGLTYEAWTPAEDELLWDLVARSGWADSARIASRFNGRSIAECIGRWMKQVKFDSIKGIGRTWKPDEDARLVLLVGTLGNAWTLISERLSIGCTPRQCRGRMQQLRSSSCGALDLNFPSSKDMTTSGLDRIQRGTASTRLCTMRVTRSMALAKEDLNPVTRSSAKLPARSDWSSHSLCIKATPTEPPPNARPRRQRLQPSVTRRCAVPPPVSNNDLDSSCSSDADENDDLATSCSSLTSANSSRSCTPDGAQGSALSVGGAVTRVGCRQHSGGIIVLGHRKVAFTTRPRSTTYRIRPQPIWFPRKTPEPESAEDEKQTLDDLHGKVVSVSAVKAASPPTYRTSVSVVHNCLTAEDASRADCKTLVATGTNLGDDHAIQCVYRHLSYPSPATARGLSTMPGDGMIGGPHSSQPINTVLSSCLAGSVMPAGILHGGSLDSCRSAVEARMIAAELLASEGGKRKMVQDDHQEEGGGETEDGNLKPDIAASRGLDLPYLNNLCNASKKAEDMSENVSAALGTGSMRHGSVPASPIAHSQPPSMAMSIVATSAMFDTPRFSRVITPLKPSDQTGGITEVPKLPIPEATLAQSVLASVAIPRGPSDAPALERLGRLMTAPLATAAVAETTHLPLLPESTAVHHYGSLDGCASLDGRGGGQKVTPGSPPYSRSQSQCGSDWSDVPAMSWSTWLNKGYRINVLKAGDASAPLMDTGDTLMDTTEAESLPLYDPSASQEISADALANARSSSKRSEREPDIASAALLVSSGLGSPAGVDEGNVIPHPPSAGALTRRSSDPGPRNLVADKVDCSGDVAPAGSVLAPDCSPSKKVCFGNLASTTTQPTPAGLGPIQLQRPSLVLGMQSPPSLMQMAGFSGSGQWQAGRTSNVTSLLDTLGSCTLTSLTPLVRTGPIQNTLSPASDDEPDACLEGVGRPASGSLDNKMAMGVICPHDLTGLSKALGSKTAGSACGKDAGVADGNPKVHFHDIQSGPSTKSKRPASTSCILSPGFKPQEEQRSLKFPPQGDLLAKEACGAGVVHGPMGSKLCLDISTGSVNSDGAATAVAQPQRPIMAPPPINLAAAQAFLARRKTAGVFPSPPIGMTLAGYPSHYNGPTAVSGREGMASQGGSAASGVSAGFNGLSARSLWPSDHHLV